MPTGKNMLSKLSVHILVGTLFYPNMCLALSAAAMTPRIDLTLDTLSSLKICIDLKLSEREDKNRNRYKIYTVAVSYPDNINGSDFYSSRVLFDAYKDQPFELEHQNIGGPQRGALTFWVSPAQIKKMKIELSYSGSQAAVYIMDFAKLTPANSPSTSSDFPNGYALNYSCREKFDTQSRSSDQSRGQRP
jgi:hypothetical protein